MSLLMDALRKAEQAKRGSRLDGTLPGEPNSTTVVDCAEDRKASALAPEQPATLPDLPPIPQSDTRTAPVTLPELPLELERLDNEFMAEASRKPAPVRPRPQSANSGERRERAPAQPSTPPFLKPAQPSVTEAANRATAQNAFAAKQQSAAGNRHFGVIVGAITLLAVGVIGVYFWLQIKPTPGLSPTRPVAAPGAPASVPATGLNPARTRNLQPALGPAPSAAEPPRTRPAVRAAETRTSPADAYSPIRITTSQPTLNPTLTQGYEAFQAGNLAAARADYERVLQSDPRNPDALHGAAAVALREARSADAQGYYLRLLEANPQDAIALASLVGLNGHGDPVATESRLKTMLAAQPDAPALHFALGNLYARQSRWSEAQQAYFNAVTNDGNNPDYLFNLAVSLDQLHQPKLAAQHYRQALTAAAVRPAAFDQARAAGRLRDLQP